MSKTILITGSTDGIGLATAQMLASEGHRILLHGRNSTKLEEAEKVLAALPAAEAVETYVADLSDLKQADALAKAVGANHESLDVLINNAGVYNTPNAITADGFDVRFVVNTIAPFLLTQELLPLMDASGRVVNLSSAAQSSVNLDALAGKQRLSDGEAYAQSKLALTMWSRVLGLQLGGDGPVIVAVNPGSLLGSKMVKDAFGVAGGDIRIGADILSRAALSDEFAKASGQYFDNDSGQFASPYPEALDDNKSRQVVEMIEALLAENK